MNATERHETIKNSHKTIGNAHKTVMQMVSNVERSETHRIVRDGSVQPTTFLQYFAKRLFLTDESHLILFYFYFKKIDIHNARDKRKSRPYPAHSRLVI